MSCATRAAHPKDQQGIYNHSMCIITLQVQSTNTILLDGNGPALSVANTGWEIKGTKPHVYGKIIYSPDDRPLYKSARCNADNDTSTQMKTYA